MASPNLTSLGIPHSHSRLVTQLFPHPSLEDVLRDESPEITRAEAEAGARIAWELIYKQRATLKGNHPQKPGIGPLALLCLLTPSLNPPCYIMDYLL